MEGAMPANRLDVLQHELAAERAESLRSVADHLERSLDALRRADAAPVPPSTATRTDLLDEAARWLWYYIIQREALGWRDHTEALALYRVPYAVQARMGIRRPRGW
jgi:uncharacterized protein DUF6665